MRVDRHKNFLSLEDCDALNAWVDEGVEKGWLDVGYSGKENGYKDRLTTRFYGQRFEYPQLVHDVFQRIRDFYSLSSYPYIDKHGRDGVVVSCIFDGGDLYPHKDPRNGSYAALRCNVMTRKPESGGILHLDDQQIDLEVGELHCYLASEFEHKVTTIHGDTSRVLWMFGVWTPMNDWESGKIKHSEAICTL